MHDFFFFFFEELHQQHKFFGSERVNIFVGILSGIVNLFGKITASGQNTAALRFEHTALFKLFCEAYQWMIVLLIPAGILAIPAWSIGSFYQIV